MELSRGQKLLVIIGLGAILLALLILSLNHARQSRDQMSVEYVTPHTEALPQYVAVHVVGAVNQPGVYWLPTDARVSQAIAQAGGFRPDADVASVNLAAYVEDGRQISVKYASVSGPIAQAPPKNTAPPLSPTPAAGITPVAGPTPPAGKPRQSGHSLELVSGKLLSLSTASPAELETLPEVGPVLALNIVYYRNQHGPFASVNDLLKVPGFGEQRLEAVRPYVAP